MNKLKLSRGNNKLGPKIWHLALPAGHSCPFAHNCLSKAERETGKITDGRHTQFRCYAASSEARYPNARRSRWHNFELLRGKGYGILVKILLNSLTPVKEGLFRIHTSGDFFSYDYFCAWMSVARMRPEIRFYGYTKALTYWVRFMSEKGPLPSNVLLTASYGGRNDHLIEEHGLRYSVVVYSFEEAENMGLRIDKDDSIAYSSRESFALLIHGSQPKGSKASKAVAFHLKQKREKVEAH